MLLHRSDRGEIGMATGVHLVSETLEMQARVALRDLFGG
jgi:hypothetical protein